jgi:hypothetical protein
LSGFKPISLVSTINSDGVANLALFSNIIHLGSDPALIGIVNRPREASPHTLGNIESNGLFTINHVHSSFVEAAHQTSAKYGREVNEYVEVGLTPEYKENFSVPYVKESSVQYGLELSEIIPIKANDTFLIIGKLKQVFLDESIVSHDGFINIQRTGSMASLGMDAYYETIPVKRFKYAKVGVTIQELTF